MSIREEMEELAEGVGSFIGPTLYPDKKRIDFEVGPCLISYEWCEGNCFCSVIDIENHDVIKTTQLGPLEWGQWIEIYEGFKTKEDDLRNYGGTDPWEDLC